MPETLAYVRNISVPSPSDAMVCHRFANSVPPRCTPHNHSGTGHTLTPCSLGRRHQSWRNILSLSSELKYTSVLKMEAALSSETLDLPTSPRSFTTRRHRHLRENRRSRTIHPAYSALSQQQAYVCITLVNIAPLQRLHNIVSHLPVIPSFLSCCCHLRFF
jgi:hypothetical protein